MEIVQFQPETVQSLTLPLKEVRLMPIGDIQYGAQGCDLDRLERHLAWGVKQKCHYIGMADYLDVASPSNRKILAAANTGLYDSVREMMDEAMTRQLEKLQDILAPTRGKWFGLLKGHHYWQFQDGTTTDSRLAEFLGAPFLGDCAVIVLKFKGKNGKTTTAKIWAHHGQGGGMTTAAPLNKLEAITKVFYANVYLIAHYHRKAAAPLPFIDCDVDAKGNVVWKTTNRYLVATGGFLKGYEAGTKDGAGLAAGSYVENKMLVPTALGGPVVYIRPREDGGIDCNVSV